MGLSKDILANKEKYKEKAFKILLEMGTIKCCDVHDGYYYSTDNCDVDSTYAIATSILKKQNDFENYNDFSIFHEAINDILKQAAATSDCPVCYKVENE